MSLILKYQDQASRTVKPPTFVLTVSQVDLIRFVFGLAGEAGELLEYSIKAINVYSDDDTMDGGFGFMYELGDYLWYASAICTTVGLDLSELIRNAQKITDPNMGYGIGIDTSFLTSLRDNARLCHRSCVVVDYVKKGIFHQDGIDPDRMHYLLTRCLVVLMEVIRKCDLTVGGVMQANIDKLLARHPDAGNLEKTLKRTK